MKSKYLFQVVFGFALVFKSVYVFSLPITKKEYVEQWRNVCVQQMHDYKIPACITMAQAILESGSGNSELAINGKNHFGIKCHGWTGKTMHIDDDQKGECFRVYEKDQESFVDHSRFLVEKKRYSNLFNLNIKDYKSWAYGLKEAGYATNPKYPELLIAIIEEMNLIALDVSFPTPNTVPDLVSKNQTKQETDKHIVYKHQVKTKFVIVKKGDTFYQLSKELGVAMWQLRKYNDFDSKSSVLKEGERIYIQPKRKRGATEVIKLEQSMTLRECSQFYGVQLDALLKRNKELNVNDVIVKGKSIHLR